MPISKKKKIIKKSVPKPKQSRKKKPTDLSSKQSNTDDNESFITTSEQPENEIVIKSKDLPTLSKDILPTEKSDNSEIDIDETIENIEDDKEDKEEDKEEDTKKNKDEEDDDDENDEKDEKSKKHTDDPPVFLEDEGEEYDDPDCVYRSRTQHVLDDDEMSDYDFYETDIPVSYISEEERITTRKLTKYERVRILSERVKQLSTGAQHMIPNTEYMAPEDLAKLELQMKVCPFYVERLLPSNKIELIDVNTLKILN